MFSWMHFMAGHCLAQKQPVYEAKHSCRYKQAAMVPVYAPNLNPKFLTSKNRNTCGPQHSAADASTQISSG